MSTPDASVFTRKKRDLAMAGGVGINPFKNRASAFFYKVPTGLSLTNFLPFINKSFREAPATPSTTVSLSYTFKDLQTTCRGSVGRLVITATFGVILTEITELGGAPFTILSDYDAELVIPTYTVSSSDSDIPFSFTLNNATYATSGTVTIGAGTTFSLQVPQMYNDSPGSVPFFSGGSIYFTGDQDGFVCSGASSDFEIADSADFTVMWWQYLIPGKTQPCIFSMGNTSSSFSFKITTTGIFIVDASIIKIGTKTQADVVSGWHHIALIRHNNTMTLYIDGLGSGSFSSSSSYGNSTDSFLLGQWYSRDLVSQSYHGFISKFIFDNGYARYTTDFNPPVSDPQIKDDTVLALLCSNFNTVDFDSSSSHKLVGFYGDTRGHTPGFSSPGDILFNTPFSRAYNTLGQSNWRTTDTPSSFVAPLTGTYKFIFDGANYLKRVLETTTSASVISDATAQISSYGTLSLTSGEKIYLMPIAAMGQTLELLIQTASI
jgi:hypothetical protein